MEFELLSGPHTVNEVRQLVKEDNVFLIINTYRILSELYTKAKKDVNEIDPDDCWKLKSLKKLYERSNDPEVFIHRVTLDWLVRITRKGRYE